MKSDASSKDCIERRIPEVPRATAYLGVLVEGPGTVDHSNAKPKSSSFKSYGSVERERNIEDPSKIPTIISKNHTNPKT